MHGKSRAWGDAAWETAVAVASRPLEGGVDEVDVRLGSMLVGKLGPGLISLLLSLDLSAQVPL